MLSSSPSLSTEGPENRPFDEEEDDLYVFEDNEEDEEFMSPAEANSTRLFARDRFSGEVGYRPSI